MKKNFIATLALLAALGVFVPLSTAHAQSVASPDQNKTDLDKTSGRPKMAMNIGCIHCVRRSGPTELQLRRRTAC